MRTVMPAGVVPPPSRDLARVTLSVISLGVLIAGSLWVLRPFVPALLWATMIVVSTWPFMLRIQTWLGGRRGAAVAVMTVIWLLILIVPLYLAVSTLVEQSGRIATLIHQLPTMRIPPPPAWVSGLPLIGSRAAARWLALSALEGPELGDKLAPYLRDA